MSCGHHDCDYAELVSLPEEVGPWHRVRVSALLGPDGKQIVVPWEGQPLYDAYGAHMRSQHPENRVPKIVWRVVE